MEEEWAGKKEERSTEPDLKRITTLSFRVPECTLRSNSFAEQTTYIVVSKRLSTYRVTRFNSIDFFHVDKIMNGKSRSKSKRKFLIGIQQVELHDKVVYLGFSLNFIPRASKLPNSNILQQSRWNVANMQRSLYKSRYILHTDSAYCSTWVIEFTRRSEVTGKQIQRASNQAFLKQVKSDNLFTSPAQNLYRWLTMQFDKEIA